MKIRAKKGFVLILVILIIELVGIVTFIMANEAQTIVFQANNMYLQACERNLIASGLAWSEINIQKESGDISGKMIELDVAEMNIRDSSLSVKPVIPADGQPQVQISTSCSRGRNTLTNHDTYSIRQ